MKKQTVFFFILLIIGNMMISAQSCNINAGANAVICGTSANLSGSPGGSTVGNPLWTLVSKPSGAQDPVIVTPSGYNTNVTGMTSPGNYVFQIAQNCTTGTATSQVTITAPGDVSSFTAGPDITNISANTGTATLNAVIPAGYTASWTYYNIYNKEYYNQTTTTNATMSNTTTAAPTLTLIKKANHDIDPAYRAVLRITSINNPNCWYEDDAIVRFIPNPQISIPAINNRCYPSTDTNRYISLSGTSPMFASNTANSSGNPAFGTTITVNVISQPAGGNISFYQIRNSSIYFNGVNVTGAYVFTITVTNANGTYTTPQITYNYNGADPKLVSFIDASYPEQMQYYSASGTGGAVYCNMAGTTVPITIYFKIDPSDPATLTSTVSNSGIAPPGGSPTLILNGAGTMNRNVVVTPPAGGWRVGTYVVNLSIKSGVCGNSQDYYIHISDGNRPNVAIPNTTICYTGSGIVTATVPLPAIYQGMVNTSYLQGFLGKYDLTLVSKPAGAAIPVYEASNLRTLTNTSTTISNLDKQGEYVFKIKPVPNAGGVDPRFLDKEYTCSGTSPEGTFSIFVSPQVNANAGSNQTLGMGASEASLNGNNPGASSSGLWTLVSKPVGAPDPLITNPSLYNTTVTGLISSGIYTFRWTITTGTCTSTSDLTITVTALGPGGVSGADFWVKSDDAGTIATAWKDHSANADHIPNVGGVTLSPADRNHNFNPYTTGYTAFKFFHNPTSAMNPTNAELPNISQSIFSAVRPTTAGTGRITGIDDEATYGSQPGVSIANGKPRHYEYLNVITSTDFSTTFNYGISNIFSAIANNSVTNGGTSTFSGGEKRLGLNGAYETTSFNNSNKFQLYGRNLRVGHAGWDASGAFPGDIMEILWFKRTLTVNEQSRINSYLAVKNGVTLNENYLSTASDVIWDRTLNINYNNNIFGIAKDNLTLLHQKQSGSTNNGQKLVISTTGFAESNATNTTGLANDMQFLMTGDNGLKQSFTMPLSYTIGSNGVVNQRFEAIWKVQNTNNVGTITVAWPKGLKNLYLVQSTDAAFDATDTFTSMTTEVTVNGVVYNTANVVLSNGQYFTFAGFVQAPGGVVGPDFWVKSDDAGAVAAAWKDHSANADHIPNVGGVALSPADRNHNFYPYTTGYTSSKFFYNNAALMNPLGNVEMPNTNTSIFSAVRPTTANGTGRITGIDDDTNAAEPGVSIANGKPRQYEFFNTITSSDFSTAFNTGISNVFSAIANNTVANGGTSSIPGGEKQLGLNGSYESFSGFPAGNKFQIYGKNLRIGHAGWDAPGPFPGDIMEIVWYNRLLTANEQSRVNSYLAVKNGVTLSENYLSTASSIVWDRTTNAGYNSNIFGIAKDDFTALDQKQAGSVNNGQQLVISTTGFADSNASNTTALANDLQYLITGDNNLRQSLTIPLTYSGGSNGVTNYRFESVWKVQNTNNVGTVTVAWPKSVKNLYLIQSPDETFDTADTFTPMATEVTVNGIVYNTVNVTLGNGQFFTFAGFGLAPGGVASNLSYWYRADKNADNTGTGTDVTGWTDLWNGTTVSQRVTNALPKYAVGTSSYFNFNPGINFTAINQTLGNIVVQTVTNTSNDIFTVTKEGMTAPSSPNPHFLSIGMDNVNTTISNWDYMGMYPTTNVIERRVVGGGTQMVNSGLIYSSTIPSIMYNTFTNTTLARGLNGAANAAPVNYTGVGLALGGHIFGDTRWTGSGSDNGGFIGNLGETIIYGSGNLTAAERRRVDSYLAIKYGITLGQVNTEHYLNTDGNTVWNGATNTTFNNNIFGISRDDIEAFEQKVSKSVNAGTILSVATINDFASPNQLAARTGFANDKTYFLLGDNNVTTTPLVNITISGNIMQRIQRTWLSQRSNTPGSLYFEADLSAYGSAFTSGNNIQMIVADDNAFTTNVKTIAGVFTGSRWVFMNDFNSDNTIRYITFAEAKTYCYKPGALPTAGNPALSTKVGITALGRAGSGSTDNWPMVRKGGWLAMEAKTKGFVPNRVKFNASNQPVAADGITPVITTPVEGMMVYDTTNKCMKMYTLKEGDTSMAWHCISTQACPD